MKQEFKSVKHSCDHTCDVIRHSNMNNDSLRKILENSICDDCKTKEVNIIKERDEKAVNIARKEMENAGFKNCSYNAINYGKAVEVTLYINIR